MTAISAPTRLDVRRPNIVGVILAVAGRLCWRFWWPLALWLMVAAVARLWLATGPRTAEGDPMTYAMIPGSVLLLATPVMVAVLWLWGARFALALGHARSAVFALTAISSLVLAIAFQLVASTATVVEYRLVGLDGLRVFLSETSDKFGTNTAIINGGTALMAIYGLPLLGLIIPICAGILGRGVVGAVVGLLGGITLALSGFLVWAALSNLVNESPLSQTASACVGNTLAIAAMMALGWALFRKART